MSIKIKGIERFDGDRDKFPLFSTKFKGIVYSLGTKYAKALKRKKPYNTLRYGEEPTIVTAAATPPPKQACLSSPNLSMHKISLGLKNCIM